MKKIKKYSFLKNLIFIIIGLGLLFASVFILWISTLKLPDFKSFNDRKVQSSTKIYDRTGEILLYDLHQDIKRTVIPYEEMGTNILNATVAIEDSGEEEASLLQIFKPELYSKNSISSTIRFMDFVLHMPPQWFHCVQNVHL